MKYGKGISEVIESHAKALRRKGKNEGRKGNHATGHPSSLIFISDLNSFVRPLRLRAFA
jgi:hypothetical protein